MTGQASPSGTMRPAAGARRVRGTRRSGSGHRVRRAVSVLGELLITAGVLVGLFAAYELWGTGVYTAAAQHSLRNQLERDWNHPSGATGPAGDELRLGHGLALLAIPRLGRNWQRVVVSGVGREDLKKGPGHYPGTALPGQPGNFAVAGHRTTYGAPFNGLDRLRPGDLIGVETRADWYVYRVVGSEIVAPWAGAVLAPVPDHPGSRPTVAMLTLTTCNPKYSARQRLIVHARLASSASRADGTPAALADAGVHAVAAAEPVRR